MAIDQIIRQCKTVLQNYYGPRLKGVVLYGSVARNEACSESDIDLMRGKWEKFSLEMLITLEARTGRHMILEFAGAVA